MAYFSTIFVFSVCRLSMLLKSITFTFYVNFHRNNSHFGITPYSFSKRTITHFLTFTFLISVL